jgi:hypothetical protein
MAGLSLWNPAFLQHSDPTTDFARRRRARAKPARAIGTTQGGREAGGDMSTPDWVLRTRERFPLGQLPKLPSLGRWIGVDFAGQDGSRSARKLLPLLVLALVTALGIAALRIDLIRIRYAMASAVNEETALREEQRNLIVRRRQLRDPTLLDIQARARGFRPATSVVVLDEPTHARPHHNRVIFEKDLSELPSVASGPPNSGPRGDWR